MKRQVAPTPAKKVCVGLSGGVDSSVSAALLKKAGYDVTGVFIKVWQPDWITCTWKEDRLDAMRVCAKLDIPFVTLDLEKEYKREVVDYMINEYKAGRTPNPDVMCNAHVKFGAFYDWAMENGADYVSTGHYAEIKDDSLYAAADDNKDQTYFLWTIRKDQLPRILFPIGHLKKPEVRKLAQKLGLATAHKKDSQGLCFIGKVDMKDFLREFVALKEGSVLDEDGLVIGRHSGALLYTLGERHGFEVTKKTPNDEPHYVISKDVENNTLTVSHKDKGGKLARATTHALISSTNWTCEIEPHKKYHARARYRQELSECKIETIGDLRAKITFSMPQNSLSPGQSLVVYDGKYCIGGGIIE